MPINWIFFENRTHFSSRTQIRLKFLNLNLMLSLWETVNCLDDIHWVLRDDTMTQTKMTFDLQLNLRIRLPNPVKTN